ncbi:serine/threonine protein kinase, partial [Myxococcota bacterium]|nr:serine/threonine protein kinase [Myxococcota bacterium]
MKPGTVIGGAFEVRRALGGGASAEVFHALDRTHGFEVAIKLFPRSGLREEEFRREAGIAMRNVHPNLVRLVDAGVHEGRPWLALEYVDGMNARALLYREGRTVHEVLDLVRQVLAALDAMHGAGLVHGDIKPENVLVQDRHVRVVDFGRTRLGHVLPGGRTHAGTPPYMHPSLFRGQAPSPSTDCFAAWVMAWELLTSERPWTREELQAEAELPTPPPLPDPALDQLVRAGLDGRLADARSGWLATSRFLVGRRDLPRPRAAPRAPRAEGGVETSPERKHKNPPSCKARTVLHAARRLGPPPP